MATIAVPRDGGHATRNAPQIDLGLAADVVVVDVEAAWKQVLADKVVADADREALRNLTVTIDIRLC